MGKSSQADDVNNQSWDAVQSKVSDNTDKIIEKCKNLKQIRKGCSDIKEEILKSVKPTKEFIANVMQRLELKGKKF